LRQDSAIGTVHHGTIWYFPICHSAIGYCALCHRPALLLLAKEARLGLHNPSGGLDQLLRSSPIPSVSGCVPRWVQVQHHACNVQAEQRRHEPLQRCCCTVITITGDVVRLARWSSVITSLHETCQNDDGNNAWDHNSHLDVKRQSGCFVVPVISGQTCRSILCQQIHAILHCSGFKTCSIIANIAAAAAQRLLPQHQLSNRNTL